MPIHETLNGELLDYEEPTGALAAFIEHVRAAVDDVRVGEGEMLSLIYGAENPMLDHSGVPGRHMVTAATLARPEHRLLSDLLDRKRLALGRLDLVAARARHTLTVTDAAARLGVHASAVRQAIERKVLPAWKDSGRIWLDPAAVDAYASTVTKRGPSPRLDVCMGSAPGISFRLKAASALEQSKKTGELRTGILSSWKRVALLIGHDKDYRLLVIEPGGEPQEITAGEGKFYVRGRFTIVSRENNSRLAREAFDAFSAA